MIYFIRDRQRKAIKIGRASDPARRLAQLQIGCCTDLELMGVVPGDEGREREFHAMWSLQRIRGEWFEETVHLADWIDRMLGTDLLETCKALEDSLRALYERCEDNRSYSDSEDVDLCMARNALLMAEGAIARAAS